MIPRFPRRLRCVSKRWRDLATSILTARTSPSSGISRRALLVGAGAATLVLSVRPAWAAIAVVAGTEIQLVGGGTSAAFDSRGATMATVHIPQYSGVATITPTDDQGNTYIPVVSQSGGVECNSTIFICQNPNTSATHHITSLNTIGSTQIRFFSGSFASTQPAISPTGARTFGTQTQLLAGSTTPPYPNSLIIVGNCNDAGSGSATSSIDSSFTIGTLQSPFVSGTREGGAFAYLVQTAAATVNPKWTMSASAPDIASTIVVLGAVPPPAATITYSVGPGGDIPNLSPSGNTTTGSWSGGVATITTAAPHGQTVGSIAAGFMNSASVVGNAWLGEFVFTFTGASTFTYPIVSNPGSYPSGTTVWGVYSIYTAMGGAYGTPDFTYSTSGTCPSTAADSSHIVLSGATSACVGHPVTWTGSGTATCLITAFAAGVATVSAIAGYPANFGATPQSGDAYSIAYTWNVFVLNYSDGISAPWTLTAVNENLGVVKTGQFIGAAGVNELTIKGITPYLSKSQPAGTPGNGSLVTVQLSNNSVDQNHTSIFGVGAALTTFQSLQIDSRSGDQLDGCFTPTNNFTGAWSIIDCVVRGDDGTNDRAHTPWLMNGNFTFAGPVNATNCIFVSTDPRASLGTQVGILNPKFCTFLSTQNLLTTITSPVSSGTTIVVASATGIEVGDATHTGSFASLINSGSITAGANVVGLSGTGPFTVVLQAGSVAGSIAAGTTIAFDTMLSVGATTLTASNCAFFGIIAPSGTLTACAVDLNPAGLAGLTTVSYANSINAGSGLLQTGTVDARLPIGSPLRGAGVYDPTVPLDIFGQTRPNPPSIGAAEFINAGVSSGIIGGGVGSFPMSN